MRVLVTGVAGFIGSTTAARLLASGTEVLGVDALTNSYDSRLKRRNLMWLREHGSFEFVHADLADQELVSLIERVDCVVHLAALPGVRASWGDQFAEYERNNVLVTQRLLEACRTVEMKRFVYASSSSIYGQAERLPAHERDLPRPVSPYGVTKLAGEHLCTLYATNFGVPTVSLRYFTVFGPRQRPDMAINLLITAAIEGRPFVVYGDGEQIRDFTYVDDVVDANVRALDSDVHGGSVFNIGGGVAATLREVIALVEQSLGRSLQLEFREMAAGDPRRTGADTTAAAAGLGWSARTSLAEGIAAQCHWQEQAAV